MESNALKVISQDTFDDVVKENVVDFSMTPDEAREETVRQFEAQGVNLANIIKDLSINSSSGRPVLNEVIEQLKTYLEEKSTNSAQLIENLVILEAECKKSLPHRVLAGKNGAHEVLFSLLEEQLKGNSLEQCNLDIIKKSLLAMNSLSLKQPDLFNAQALKIIIQMLEYKYDDIICLTLQWLQKVTVMHEINRQNLMKAGIVKLLKPLIGKENPILLKEILMVLRYLVLDDDIRVEFGCAHEHARQIASELIVDLTKLLGELEDVNILSELILTLGTLAVRQEFCKTIDEAGGLRFVLDLMISNPDAERLHREAFKFLRALAGNDSVKVRIVQEGLAPIAKELLHQHMETENFVINVLACVSTLTLRVKANSEVMFETGIAETIVEALRTHPKNKIVQRNGAWAIRNMVSRSREQCETWLSYGVEDLLNEAMKEHPSVSQDIKAALRDLGCKVDLKEEWTGTAEKKIVNKI